MPADLNILEAKALELHGKLPYGNGKTMYDQVKQSALLAAEKRGDSLAALAWLHKSQEPSRLNPGLPPLLDEEIEGLLIQAKFSPEEVQQIVESLVFLKSAAPAEEKGKAEKNLYWEGTWAITGPVLAQSFLVIEKLINFRASLEVLKAIQVDPDLLSKDFNKKRPPQWHANYCDTRGKVVENIATHSPALKDFCDEVLAVGKEVHALASLINAPAIPASTLGGTVSLSQNLPSHTSSPSSSH